MSEFTNRKAGRAETQAATVSPVALADALEFAGLPGPTDPLMDSLLAAQALHHDYILATRNIDDFKVSGIQLINPWGTDLSS